MSYVKNTYRNELDRVLSRIEQIKRFVAKLESWTFRELRNQMMKIHRDNGLVFNDYTVQVILNLDAPKRWSNCCKSEVLTLLRHWYRVKMTQAGVYFFGSDFAHTLPNASEPVLSQRGEYNQSIILWTTRFGVNSRKRAYELLERLAPYVKCACILDAKKASRMATECPYEIKAWGVTTKFLDAFLTLDGWTACAKQNPYPNENTDVWESRQRALKIRTAYTNARSIDELRQLKTQYSELELHWVLELWSRVSFPDIWRHIMALCGKLTNVDIREVCVG